MREFYRGGHCFRNQQYNMAIERLNKVLKHTYNERERKWQNCRSVGRTCWWEDVKKDSERPNANHYQHKIAVLSHKKAKKIKNLIERIRLVKSTSEKFYIVSYKVFCEEDCRKIYCSECKICPHRYNCEFVVKTSLSKHTHAVVWYEWRMNKSVPGNLQLGKLEQENMSPG